MSGVLQLLMAQINPVVGAIRANAEKICQLIQSHQEEQDVILFPELALTGYPPEDLLLREDFHEQVKLALKRIQQTTRNCYIIVGHPSVEEQRRYNAASIFYQAECIACYHKQHLPNSGVFDEQRYFTSGLPKPCILSIKGYSFGVCICEDLWLKGPIEQLLEAKIQGVFSLNASPFDYQKQQLRENRLRDYAKQGLIMIYVNQVGGQDELVFDGQSMIFNAQGKLMVRYPAFKEHWESVTLTPEKILGGITPLLSKNQLIYEALVCGTRDYVEKNGFHGVLLGLSGGIDSALTLAIAVDALGASRVHAVMMPSRYSASMSLDDAKKQVEKLNVSNTCLSIEPLFQAFLDSLAPIFSNYQPDVTEENIQARIRGVLLMALSNKLGYLVLTTSNKSEMAVGYSTLYGDMVGGLAILKDVLKTQVYELARYRNQLSPIIPERVLTRAPSAELAPNQTDQDSLPDYETLDAILKAYVESNRGTAEIIDAGYSPEIVHKVIALIQRNEYKRRQAAPGIKITPRAFDRDWRLPITSGFNP